MGFKIKNGILLKYKGKRDVTEITIPDSVTTIGAEAFYNCKTLKALSYLMI